MRFENGSICRPRLNECLRILLKLSLCGLASGLNYGHQVSNGRQVSNGHQVTQMVVKYQMVTKLSNQASELYIRSLPTVIQRKICLNRTEVICLRGSTTDHDARATSIYIFREVQIPNCFVVFDFSMDVKDTMQSVNGGYWYCLVPERFIPARVKYVESTFCLVKFDGAKYYIFRDQKN